MLTIYIHYNLRLLHFSITKVPRSVMKTLFHRQKHNTYHTPMYFLWLKNVVIPNYNGCKLIHIKKNVFFLNFYSWNKILFSKNLNYITNFNLFITSHMNFQKKKKKSHGKIMLYNSRHIMQGWLELPTLITKKILMIYYKNNIK